MPKGVYIRTKENTKNLNKSKIGISLSEETKRKISDSKKGIIAHNKGKQQLSTSGNKNHFWNGGWFISSQGYVFIYNPKHPSTNRNGYVPEHRLVMEKIIQRYLLPEERVHHIDENKKNNNPNNLILFSSESEHQKYHCLLNPIKWRC